MQKVIFIELDHTSLNGESCKIIEAYGRATTVCHGGAVIKDLELLQKYS